MPFNILILAGDGIGPEIMSEATKVLDVVRDKHKLDIQYETELFGGIAYDSYGSCLPEVTLQKALAADAVLLGSVGGPDWDALPRAERCETALLKLRQEMGVFANLRPAVMFEGLEQASSLKSDLVNALDVLIVRELTGGIYFGQPRGIRMSTEGEQREGFNTMIYSESEVSRVAHVAFKAAEQRGAKLCSVDKSNVLETSQLWREVVTDVGRQYPHVKLEHMLVDNAAMQLATNPKQFDTIVTGNLFGDILSDLAACLVGSIGLLASASLNESSRGLYEPIHGSAPDIAGQGKANPLGAILSLAMLLRHSGKMDEAADDIDNAVIAALKRGLRTSDLLSHSKMPENCISTTKMGDAIVEYLIK